MRQAIMTSPGIIEYREIPKPESLGSMEVLLKIERIGVCGSDIHVFHGEHPATPYPVVQGHEGLIVLLPAMPKEWYSGEFHGLCTRGAFELDMQWDKGVIRRVELLSKAGAECKISADGSVSVSANGKAVQISVGDGYVEFPTEAGQRYHLEY